MDISSELEKSLKYFNDIAIATFLKIPLSLSASVFPNNLALYAKDLKPLVFAISALKLITSSFE